MIDCFSKKGSAVPVNDNSGVWVTKAIESILPKKNVKHIQSDQGLEFFNKHFSAMMKSRGINHYHTFTHLKDSIIEKFNKTIKQWMWRQLSIQENYMWFDMLPKLLRKYNN